MNRGDVGMQLKYSIKYNIYLSICYSWAHFPVLSPKSRGDLFASFNFSSGTEIIH